eukprot:CAMPEP_0184687264 /NCGR_PEP_ID=MMETSP0312-20130426/25796_1 /TAXON_ID=31354 /ORGANISM="Compsopogon coeruleus, Strain SAG 36.94" /LENGTH=139 /DNA_ID=CAMNT_0027143213 /DNA_START=19 /DNA_END=439 /DNA_ORIENTATION=+
MAPKYFTHLSDQQALHVRSKLRRSSLTTITGYFDSRSPTRFGATLRRPETNGCRTHALTSLPKQSKATPATEISIASPSLTTLTRLPGLLRFSQACHPYLKEPEHHADCENMPYTHQLKSDNPNSNAPLRGATAPMAGC